MFGGKLESCLHFRKNYKRSMQKTVPLHFPISPLVFSMSNPFRPRNCMSQLAASSGLKRNKKTMDFFFSVLVFHLPHSVINYWLLLLFSSMPPTASSFFHM